MCGQINQYNYKWLYKKHYYNRAMYACTHVAGRQLLLVEEYERGDSFADGAQCGALASNWTPRGSSGLSLSLSLSLFFFFSSSLSYSLYICIAHIILLSIFLKTFLYFYPWSDIFFSFFSYFHMVLFPRASLLLLLVCLPAMNVQVSHGPWPKTADRALSPSKLAKSLPR